MKNKKRLSVLLILLLVAVTTGAIVFTYSRYSSEAQGTTSAQIAKWVIKAGTQDITTTNTFTLTAANFGTNEHVAANRIAPGVTATIPVEIDVTGTEVDVDYTISVGAITKPTENAQITASVAGDATGTIAHSAVSKKKTVNVTVTWTNLETNNEVDTQTGKAAGNISVPVTVKAVQKTA